MSTLPYSYHICLLTVFQCNSTELVRPGNGNVSFDSLGLDSVATFLCMDGYDLVGNETRICTLDGWSGSNPTCNESRLISSKCVCCMHVWEGLSDSPSKIS